MSDQSEQPNPFRSRRFVLSMVVVAVIVLCAVIVLISNLAGGKNNADPTPSSSAPPSTTAPAAADPDPSVCGLNGYETIGTIDTPPPAKWVLVGTVAAPTDPKTVGPGVTEQDGFRSCFAHTPTGALYAATNIIAMGSVASLGEEVTKKLVVPGAGRDAALAQLDSSSNAATTRYQIAGFKMLSYDGSTARVDLAVNASSGQLVSFVESLQWSGGDWKVVLADNGGPAIAPAALTSLGGYMPWSGA